MSKQLHFVSGLPRACSTLLCNLLAQNIKVHATPTSPLHEIGYIARKVFHTQEVKSMDPLVAEEMYISYVRGGCEHAFNNITDRPIVIDKCRSWIGHLDQTFKVWPDAKILVPVRDIRGILSSMEKKRMSHPSPLIGFEEADPSSFTTIEKRVQGWLTHPPVGIAIERLYEASRRFGNKLHFVHAEDLTNNPKETMCKIWDYLNLSFDDHDFNNVQQYTTEKEVGWPYGDHIIRQQVKPLISDWDAILGKGLSESINQKFNWVNKL